MGEHQTFKKIKIQAQMGNGSKSMAQLPLGLTMPSSKSSEIVLVKSVKIPSATTVTSSILMSPRGVPSSNKLATTGSICNKYSRANSNQNRSLERSLLLSRGGGAV